MNTRSDASRLSGAKLMLALLIISTGMSIVIFIPVVQTVQLIGLDARAAVIPFALLGLVAHVVLLRQLVSRLVQIDLALRYLAENAPVTPLPVSASDLLRPLVEATNALIDERVSMTTMRGQLVEQISAAAAQEERNRLARDLHDSIKQQVFSMSISAAAAYAHLENDAAAARQALLDVRQSAQEAMVEMRALLQQLSPAPLEKSGLIQALREQGEALGYRTGAQVETHFGDLPPDDQLPPGTQETIFRIAQEALSNIARHARAQHVRLSLETTDANALALRITDDGRGFDVEKQPPGMGLNNIRSRAAAVNAAVTIVSTPNQGTELTITIPFIEQVEDEMISRYETQLQPIIGGLYRAAGGAALFIVSASLLTWRLVARPEGIAEDPILLFLMALLIVLAAVGLPFAAVWWARTQPKAAALLLSAGPDSRPGYRLRRHRRLAYLIIALASAWFLPIMALGLGASAWVCVAIGVTFLALLLWNYQQMAVLYRHELDLMSIEERVRELDKRLHETRSSGLTVALSCLTVAISALGNGELQFPPTHPDHWMNTAFLTFAFLMIANQFINTRVYRRWRQAAA